MVNQKESIATFKKKFLTQGIELKNTCDSLINDTILSIHYNKSWKNEKPLLIENEKCHHIPYGRIGVSFQSGRKIFIFTSNTFSEMGATYSIEIRILKTDFIFKNQKNQTQDKNWQNFKFKKIQSIQILWLDDNGWSSPKEINGQVLMMPNEKSNGIYPYGIKINFKKDKAIYILATEPDEFIESENRYKYLVGSDEFIIVFDKESAKNQGLKIKGIELEI